MSWFKSEKETEKVEILKVSDPKFKPNLKSEQVEKLLGKFILVEGGEFMMGSPADEEGKLDDEIQHKVRLNTFEIQETVVTQEMWEQVTGKNPSYNKEYGSMPVTNVSWFDAVEFCNKVSELAGLQACYSKNENGDILCNWFADGYRLPTEAEWEFAAKGGNNSKGYKYSGSDSLDEVGWYFLNNSGKIHRVKGKKPNELGIYDMSGNVWELCWDWYSDYNNEGEVEDNPHGPAQSKYSRRVLRGGSCYHDAQFCRSAYRGSYLPDNSLNYDGFRLLRTK